MTNGDLRMSLNPVSMDWFGDCSNGPQVALVIRLLCMPSFKGSVVARDGLFRPHAFNVSSAPLFPSLPIHVVPLMTVRRPSGPYHECVHFGKDGFILYADHRVVPRGFMWLLRFSKVTSRRAKPSILLLLRPFPL